ncbi:MAG: CBS domain-containing protein [Hyphomicrobiales bacterium]|nr:CBS domain-containing protein [Hyphomicrobiales bacterium]
MHARDIMTSPVITARTDTAVLDVVKLMLDNAVSALPVVDDKDVLLGLVSEGDLIRRSELGARDYSSWWLAAIGGKVRLAEEFVKTHGMQADDIMTRNLVTVNEDTLVWQIAETLEKHKIKRVPVVRDGRVVGIVSRANLLQALAAQREQTMQAPSQDDRNLRDKVLNSLSQEPWSDLPHLNVVVQEGVVHYWGRVHSEEARQALQVAARAVPGVVDVVDHTHKTVTLY